MTPAENPGEMDETELLFVFQAILRALTDRHDKNRPGDPRAARQAAIAEMQRVMANPEIMERTRSELDADQRPGLDGAAERMRAIFAEAALPGPGTPNAFNL